MQLQANLAIANDAKTQMGNHMRVLSMRYPMNTKMLFKKLCVRVLWTKIASVLEGSKVSWHLDKKYALSYVTCHND